MNERWWIITARVQNQLASTVAIRNHVHYDARQKRTHPRQGASWGPHRRRRGPPYYLIFQATVEWWMTYRTDWGLEWSGTEWV